MNVKILEFKDMLIKYDHNEINEKIIKQKTNKDAMLYLLFYLIIFIIMIFVSFKLIDPEKIILIAIYVVFMMGVLVYGTMKVCEYLGNKEDEKIRFMRDMYNVKDIRVVLYDDTILVLKEDFHILSEYEIRRFFESKGLKIDLKNNYDKTKKIFVEVDLTKEIPNVFIKNKE